MKKSWKPIVESTVLVILVSCLVLSTAYVWLTRPSERELWRISQFSRIDNLTVVGDLLLFEGYKKDNSTACVCVYAADKTTGAPIWDTEELALPHIERWRRLRSDSQIIPGRVTVHSASETDGIIYLSINGETLYALNITDGLLLWKANFDDFAFSENAIFVEDKTNLSALNKNTGIEIWRQPIGYDEEPYPSIQYENNVVYLALRRENFQRFIAFDAKTGKRMWETNTRPVAYISAVSSQALYSSNLDDWMERTYIYLSALSIDDGEKIWEVPFNEHTLGALDTKVSENQVFVIIDKNRDTFFRVARLVVLDGRTGNLVWQFNRDFSHGSISYFVNDETIYIGTEDDYVFALNRKTGQEIWRTETRAFPTYFRLDGNALIVGFQENYVSALDSKTGSQQWMLNLHVNTIHEQSWFDASEVINIENGILYVSSNEPKIYALDIRSGNILWSWNHNNIFPQHGRYVIGLLDNNVIYVIGGESPFDIAGSGLFALKATP